MRTCKICGLEKPIDQFTKQGQYYRHRCKLCNTRRVQAYYETHPDRYAKWAESQSQTRYRKHGLTKTQFSDMVNTNGAMCAICGERPWTDIDHDHRCCPGSYSCGKCVRGLLCNQCNVAAGLLRDNPGTIRSMLRYIEKSMLP